VVKKIFIRLWETSRRLGDKETQNFCNEILNTYKKYNINGNIEWIKKIKQNEVEFADGSVINTKDLY
jgi:hypothetical protein